MNTDRELLELAAKAAGLTLRWGEKYDVGGDTFDCSDMCYIKSDQPDVLPNYWNPLDDDGDALRLAVSLGLVVRVSLNHMESYLMGYPKTKASIPFNFDPLSPVHAQPEQFASARRAIVRAAAAIGEQMK